MPVLETKNQDETYMAGQKIASTLKGGEVLTLYGELGAGKTTFTRGVINFFLPQVRVLSPTFIIVRHYYPEHKLISHIVHADLYRLDNLNEIEELGLEEFMNKSRTVLLIEWADRMKSLIPKDRMDIMFLAKSDNKRKIVYEQK